MAATLLATFAVVTILGKPVAIEPVSTLQECQQGLRAIMVETMKKRPELEVHAYCVPPEIIKQAGKLSDNDKEDEAIKLITKEEYEVK